MSEWFEFARWCGGSVLIISGFLKIGRTTQLHPALVYGRPGGKHPVH